MRFSSREPVSISLQYALDRAAFRSHRPKRTNVIEGGVRLTFSNVMEIEGEAKPAPVAETISVIYD